MLLAESRVALGARYAGCVEPSYVVGIFAKRQKGKAK